MYDNPLLHVDIKFITADEFYDRVENPTIAWEEDGVLSNIINSSEPEFPYPEFRNDNSL